MHRSVFRSFLALMLCAAFFAVSGRAQNIFGSIVGTVTDQSNAVLPGASVTATNLGTGEKRTATTNGQGSYQFLSLPTGNYKVEVDSSGFKHFSRSPIDVTVDQQARVDVQMAIGEQSQQVVVNSAPPIMQTDSAAVGQVVEGKAVETLPLNGRNVLNLIALDPGVVPQGASTTNLSGQNVFAAGNYQIDGGASNQGAVLVDGASVNTLYGNAVELVMDQDDVQEFNVQMHNNTAEFGDYNGGVINMSTKSGTNTFHGTAYEYVRNTIFDANNFFANQEGTGRQTWHQNQFGANLGGPIKHNKYFFFADYQGYRQTNGQPILETLPTAAELTGDFSGISEPIYDPLTTCGYNGNPACTAAQANGTAPTRQQFVGNKIPANRMNPVAQSLIAYPIYGKPNVAGTMSPQGPQNNFFSLSTAGGKNDQLNFRGDQNLSSKQTMFERYSWWKSMNIDPKPFEPYNNLYYSALAPEAFTTQQAVIGDTYVLDPTSVIDVHLSYLRWNYTRIPTNLGLNESTAFGWPGYMNYGSLNDIAQSTSVPAININGPISYYEGQSGYIFSTNNNYGIASTYQKIWKQHTFKFGLDLRRWDENYFQNNQPGGDFIFDNVFTGSNAANPGQTGNGLASLELGYNANGTEVQVQPPVYQRLYYQGYFAQDTWQASQKLTATLGLRWEVPGTFLAGHGWEDTFNPTEVNPVVTNNGAPVLGAFDLVNTPQHPSSGATNEVWTDFEPRLGVAYRVTNNTVVRAAWGVYVTPVGLAFFSAPLQAGINYITNPMVNSINGEETPANTLSNPFPTGFALPPHRNPNYQQVLLGGNPQSITPNQPSGKTYQWNVSVEHQFPKGFAATATYSGMLGDNLPIVMQLDTLPDSVIAKAAADPNCSSGNLGSCFLNEQVPNPFYGKVSQGPLQNPTVTQNQLLRPFPQYTGLSNTGSYSGISNYEALEFKVQKQMPQGGMFLAGYNFSRLLTNAEGLTSWLDGSQSAGFQDYNNPGGEYSLSSFDTRQRLVVSYVYQLPIGNGQRFLSSLHGVGNTLIGGWGTDAIVTFQQGWPLGLSVTPDFIGSYAFQGTQRPNQVQGCSKANSGSIGSRLGGAGSSTTYFNTGCFAIPSDFSYGNEPRTDNTLRTPGIDNWDMSLFKNFPVHENMTFDFRVEAFNTFNRVQFGPPNTQLGNAQFGWITSQFNNPRELQLSGRFTF